MIGRSVVLLAGLAFAQDNAVRVIRESRVGRTRSLSLVGKIDNERVTEKALQLLGPPEVTMGQLVIYSSEEVSRMALRESQESCIPQDLLTFLNDKRSSTNQPRCPEVSEATKIGPNIVMRTVDNACRYRASLLQGTTNPLLIRALGKQHEILAISIGIAPKSIEAWGAEYPRIAVFVRTQAALDKTLAKDILAQMQKINGARDATVVIRNDSNFGKYCDFPQPFLFLAPALKQARPRGTGDVVCVSLYPHPVQCWTNRDAP